MVVRFRVCPVCLRHVLDTANVCPFCSTPARPTLRSQIALPVLAALAMGVAAGCAYGPPPEEPNEAGPDDSATDVQAVDRVASDADIGD